MTIPRIILLTTLAMLAFTGNSLLCRAALVQGHIDAASFNTIRIISGALVLWLITMTRQSDPIKSVGGNWLSALALFIYAITITFAYEHLTAGAGTLILFGAVQLTMMTSAIVSKEKFNTLQIISFILAFAGLIYLMLPSFETPALSGSILMLVSGFAWGIYSLLGRGTINPTHTTAGNLIRSIPFALITSVFFISDFSININGAVLAIICGGITSGIGYAIWYALLPALKSSQAATVQLSVPILASIAGVLFLAEPITLRLVIASIVVLGGISLFIASQKNDFVS